MEENHNGHNAIKRHPSKKPRRKTREFEEASTSKNNEQKRMRGKIKHCEHGWKEKEYGGSVRVWVCICVVMMLQLPKLLHLK